MNLFNTTTDKHRLSETDKKANDYQYYKDKCNLLDHGGNALSASFSSLTGNITEYKRRKVNYDLFNNIIDLADFSYVCSPYGDEVGELPARLTNRDIVSPKIKVLLGMEMRMPFDWKAIAVNPEATTRKEQEYFGRITDYVEGEIMNPIRAEIEKQSMQELKGKQLTPQEQQRIQQKIDEQTKVQTPDEVRKYMSREHQDPAEVQATQILEYLQQREKLEEKFNKGWKHSLLSGIEVYHVGVLNKQPKLTVVNSLFFNYGKAPETTNICDGEWATNELHMTPSEVIANFGDELTDDEIDEIYQYHNNPSYGASAMDWSFDADRYNEQGTLRVLHCTWIGLRKTGFLSYRKDGRVQKMLVGEDYKLNRKAGDISIEWEWLPQSEETYKIMSDIYVYKRPVAGQIIDMDNLYNAKLPYYGGACDDMNSQITAAMDRVKYYQYYFNIVLYRIELLMASDKGKILVANINAVPKSSGIDIHKFTYFMDANHIAWLNPMEEGKRGGVVGGDVTNLVKEIDMSLISNIMNYIQIAEYLERKCGQAIGVTAQMEGQIGPNDAVTNTKQNLVQSSYIVQPYFDFHNNVKASALQALIDTAKAIYQEYPPEALSYVLDDMSVRMLKPDIKLFCGSTIGIFLQNSTKADEAKNAIIQLAQAALQNQQAELGDIIKVIKSDNINDAEEAVVVAQQKRQEIEIMNQRAAEEAEQRKLEAMDAQQEKAWKHEEDMIVLKERERRETEIQKQTILSLGFAEDKDVDQDNVPDVLEVAKFGVDVDLKARKQNLDEEKFAQQKKIEDKKVKQEDQKIQISKNKPKTN